MDSEQWRELQMTGAENVNLLRPILVVLVHSIIRSSQLTECTRYGRDWNVKHYECHIVNSYARIGETYYLQKSSVPSLKLS